MTSSYQDNSPDRWAAQLRKGALEMAVMATLWQGRRYGLEILRHLEAEAQMVLTEGTLYPLLTRLRNDGLLAAEWVEALAGHPRKYYSLTPAGRARLHAMALAWSSFTRGVDHLLGPILQANLEIAS